MHIFSGMLRTAARPITFEPCIPIQADKPPSGPGWVHEIKHDGFRLIARRDPAGVHLITRNGHDWTDRYPAALPILRDRRRGRDDEGRVVFDRLQEGPRTKKAILIAFDLIELDGQDLRREPLLTRKATLLSLLKAAPHGILYN